MTIQQRSARVSPTPAQQPGRTDAPAETPVEDGEGTSFADHLDAATQDADDLEFSSHAKQRVAQRNISLTSTERQALTEAVAQLDEKGAQDAAILREDAAFVVNVPNRTVVTALDQAEMKNRVFTQIDSAMRM